VSDTGFGFVGESQTARKRLHFRFQDVKDGKHAQLAAGTPVSYCTRTNNSTMEPEAYAVEVLDGGRNAEALASKRASAAEARASAAGRARQGGDALRRWAERGGGSGVQKTGQRFDFHGEAKAAGAGEGLLGIVGIGGDGGEGCTTAKSWESYDLNPTGGIGFGRAYQRSRGVAEADVVDNAGSGPGGSDALNRDLAKVEIAGRAGRDTSARPRLLLRRRGADAAGPAAAGSRPTAALGTDVPKRARGGRSLADLAADGGGASMDAMRSRAAASRRW
jgi:hypothetical protein